MNAEAPDPRDIPVLTDAVDQGHSYALIDSEAVQAAVVTKTLELADSLLRQAAKDIEGLLFERVIEGLRARLPELVDSALRNHAAAAAPAHEAEAEAEAEADVHTDADTDG